MGIGIFLLNDYKQEFFVKRFFQIILGGFKFCFGYDVFVYVYINQFILFIIFFIFGGFVILFVELDIISDVVGVIFYGFLVFVFVLVVNIIFVIVQEKCILDLIYFIKKNFFVEEDEIDFVLCCGVETYEFVIFRKKFIVNIIIYVVLFGCMCGFFFWYFLFIILNVLYSNSTGVIVVIFIFGWFIVLVVQYFFIVVVFLEFVIYRTMDRWELFFLIRLFYVLVFCMFDFLYRQVKGYLIKQIFDIQYFFIRLY